MDTEDGILGTNMYAYCQNDPVNGVDPSGYKSISTKGRYGLFSAEFWDFFAPEHWDAKDILYDVARKMATQLMMDFGFSNYAASATMRISAIEFPRGFNIMRGTATFHTNDYEWKFQFLVGKVSEIDKYAFELNKSASATLFEGIEHNMDKENPFGILAQMLNFYLGTHNFRLNILDEIGLKTDKYVLIPITNIKGKKT